MDPRPRKIWLTTDTHWNHVKMVAKKFRPIDYEERIRRNWNAMINPLDVVFHLGDVICGREGELAGILENLNGTKILVRGNHDEGRSVTWFLEHGFSAVTDGIAINGAYLTHEPAVAVPPGCIMNIHGHLHDDGHRMADYQLQPFNVLLSLEILDYKPVQLADVITKFKNNSLPTSPLVHVPR